MKKLYGIVLFLSIFSLISCSTGKNEKFANGSNLKIFHDFHSRTGYKPPVITTETALFKDSQFCYLSCPTINSDENLLINHIDYLINYNKKTKYADWVAYKVNKRNLSGINNTRAWRADPKLSVRIAMVPSDYEGAALVCNYDRGHQAPLADFSNSVHWERVNYLSNITPQKAELNRGSWYNLESKIRHLAKVSEDTLYVITGPYYTGEPMCKLPNAHISNIVPNGYWKIITLVSDKGTYRLSFKFDQHTPRNADFCNHLTTTKDIEKIIKLNFNYVDSIENSKELLKMIGCSKKEVIPEFP